MKSIRCSNLTILMILLLITVDMLMVSCSNKEAEKPQEEKKEVTKNDVITLSKEATEEIKIEISEVKEGELTGAIVAPAKILPNQDLEAFVGSLVQGRVSKVFVNLGDNVKKGQTLMLIEGLQIGEIKAQFLKAKASLSYAEANYKRLKTLIEENVGSQKSYVEAKAEFDKAKAEFHAEDKKIHSIGLSDKDVEDSNGDDDHTAGFLPVKSPIDGTIVERNVVIGQLIESNTNSFRIMNTSSLLADAQIYENDLKRISGKPEVVLISTAYPEIEFKGRITYISDMVDKETRTLKIRAEISNPTRKLKPEMFAEMYIPTTGSAKALIVPAESIMKDGTDNCLFIAINDTTFEKRDVLLGSTQGEFIEIKSGVKKGEKVVGKGSFMVKSEMKKGSLEEGE